MAEEEHARPLSRERGLLWQGRPSHYRGEAKGATGAIPRLEITADKGKTMGVSAKPIQHAQHAGEACVERHLVDHEH